MSVFISFPLMPQVYGRFMHTSRMLTGRIIWKSDTPEYNLARLDYNLRFNRYPRVIVYAQKVQDVANAILWARENDVPLRARSGRHSYEAYSLVENGIVIDVSD